MQTYEKQHLTKLRKISAECTLFLKKNQEFPLTEAGNIALYGSGARRTIKGGTGSGDVNSRFYITVERGLERAGFVITTYGWLNDYDSVREEKKADFIQSVKQEAKAHKTNAIIYGMGAVMPEPEYELPLDSTGDVAVYVLSRISGEGSDRRANKGDILLSDTEIRDILELNRRFKKFMLILNVGGPVDLSPVLEVGNILLLSQLGAVTGDIVADILLGKANPSGKLTTTWTAWEDYPAIGEFGNFDDTQYTEGVYVGYRYFDSIGKKALFPFGFGLSYTDFDLKTESVAVEGTNLVVRVTVTNTGAVSGKEVAQVYVSSPEGDLDKPYQALAGWAKTKELAPGESETVEAVCAIRDLASYDEGSRSYILEPGYYIVRVGKDSCDTVEAAVLDLTEQVTVRASSDMLGEPDFKDWQPENATVDLEDLPADDGDDDENEDTAEDAEDVVIIPVNAAELEALFDEENKALSKPVREMREAAYHIFEGRASADLNTQLGRLADWVVNFTNDELAMFSCGAFNPKGGLGSIIGAAAQSVVGAAGETTGIMKDEGIPTLVMADGPAGIRITARYGVDKRGVYTFSDPIMDQLADYMPAPVKSVLKARTTINKKREGDIYEQYTTAIPIGTAIAQSWNTEFAEMCGDIVGEEMEIFGIHLWLAPALNIHRSIRCGRNFEYYSEDPLISGKFAAAITKGVQKHAGKGTTIKHFAANNQETNRYANNSQVSERAMREIYLRGFEICIRESQPAALMTSYNLLNGVHTSERRDLLEGILRDEFGYKGVVMTDWVIRGMTSGNGKYGSPEACKVSAAGNDLMMPGSKADYESILKAIKSGTLDKNVVRFNVTRVLKAVEDGTGVVIGEN